MNAWKERLSFLFAMLLGLTPAYAVVAQDIVATPVPGDAPVGILAEFRIEELPAPHAEVWWLRLELEPDGSIPAGTNPGPAVFYIETGELLVQSDGTVIPGESVATPTAAAELTLKPGDSLFVPRDVSIEARNTTSEPVRFLMLLMYSGLDEGQGNTAEYNPVGLKTAGVAIGLAEFQPGPATISMERVVVQPRESMQNVTLPGEGLGPGWMGFDLGTVETGSADVVFESVSFRNMIWPSMTGDPMAEPEMLALTADGHVEQGESYAAFNSVLTFTNTGSEPLTILRVIVNPQMGE